jgi:hypothetical protein
VIGTDHGPHLFEHQKMKPHLFILVLLSAAVMAACAGASGSDQASVPAFNACSLVTADEFAAQQGEALTDAKVTNHADGDLDISQCFLAAATFSKSVSLIVTKDARGKDPAQDMKTLWESKFSVHDDDKNKDRDKDNQPAAKPTGPDRDEEEEGSDAIKVDSLGDEAFWMGDARAGILYVLKNNSYLRISLGGADDQDTRLTKAKALATAALGRLK